MSYVQGFVVDFRTYLPPHLKPYRKQNNINVVQQALVFVPILAAATGAACVLVQRQQLLELAAATPSSP